MSFQWSAVHKCTCAWHLVNQTVKRFFTNWDARARSCTTRTRV